MLFYSISSIIVSIFIIVALILLIKENKNNLSSIKKFLIFYSITGSLLLIFGVLSFFKFFEYWQLICIGVMVISLLALVIFITINDKKDKKIKIKKIKINKKEESSKEELIDETIEKEEENI